jgi:zinc protease
MKSIIVVSCIFAGIFSQVSEAVELVWEKNPKTSLIYMVLATRQGSATETAITSGRTLLLGEMLLRGTNLRTKDKFHEDLNQMGARLEVTSRADTLFFQGAVLKSEWKKFESLVIEMIQRPAFNPKEFSPLKEELKTEILEELGEDGAIANRTLLSELFRGHPYANPRNGNVQSLNRMNLAEVKEAYRKLFRPSDLILILNGNIDKKDAETFREALDSALSSFANEMPYPKMSPAAPPQIERLILVDKPGRTQAKIVVGSLGLGFHHPKHDALALATHAFGGGYFGAFLLREIRSNKGWSYGAYAIETQAKMPHAWFLTYAPKLQDVIPSLDYMKGVIQHIKTNSLLSKEDLAFAQANLVNNGSFISNTPSKRAQNTLNEILFDLPAGYFSAQSARISKLDLRDTSFEFSEFMKKRPLLWVIVGPAQELKEAIQKALNINDDATRVIPYQEVQ